MFGTGIASAHTGVPLCKVLAFRNEIRAAFDGAALIKREVTQNLIEVCCKQGS